MPYFQSILTICAALTLAFAFGACETNSEPSKIIVTIPAKVLHENGESSSGAGELWASPRLDGDQQKGFEAQMEDEGRFVIGSVRDTSGRLWLSCNPASDGEHCIFYRLEDICYDDCHFDLRVRTTGALDLDTLDTVAPWETEEDGWATGDFKWAEVAKRDGYAPNKEGMSEFPTLRVDIEKDRATAHLVSHPIQR